MVVPSRGWPARSMHTPGFSAESRRPWRGPPAGGTRASAAGGVRCLIRRQHARFEGRRIAPAAGRVPGAVACSPRIAKLRRPSTNVEHREVEATCGRSNGEESELEWPGAGHASCDTIRERSRRDPIWEKKRERLRGERSRAGSKSDGAPAGDQSADAPPSTLRRACSGVAQVNVIAAFLTLTLLGSQPDAG